MPGELQEELINPAWEGLGEASQGGMLAWALKDARLLAWEEIGVTAFQA